MKVTFERATDHDGSLWIGVKGLTGQTYNAGFRTEEARAAFQQGVTVALKFAADALPTTNQI
jgi:hypothetical protein